MARKLAVATSLIFSAGLLVLTVAKAAAEAAPAPSTAGLQSTADELSAQSYRYRRTPYRVRVYRNRPGPNSVRICNAHYEQEYRPSGTVIVPRMNCYWRG